MISSSGKSVQRTCWRSSSDAIAVVCDQLGRFIDVDTELPGDERFAAHAPVHPSPSHIVDQPEGVCLFGEKMDAFGKEHRNQPNA